MLLPIFMVEVVGIESLDASKVSNFDTVVAVLGIDCVAAAVR